MLYGFVCARDGIPQTSRISFCNPSGLCRRCVTANLCRGTTWTRALLATEVVFVSDVVGSGSDWQGTVGWVDDATMSILRQLQRKLRHAEALALDAHGRLSELAD